MGLGWFFGDFLCKVTKNILFFVVVSIRLNNLEPWMVIISIILGVGGYPYFAIRQHEISPQAVYKKLVLAKRRKLYKKFDLSPPTIDLQD